MLDVVDQNLEISLLEEVLVVKERQVTS